MRSITRPGIYSRYPWLEPHAKPELVVMGDDLDAALSVVLFLHTHPSARLVGIYSEYKAVYYFPGVAWDDVLTSVWLDLDIYHSRCRSLGHHITRLSPGDALTGFATSCNINELFGKSVSHGFREKYPLGTVHFLMWLYEIEVPDVPGADLLIWLADSSYINSQSESWRRNRNRPGGDWEWKKRKGFRRNVRNWLGYAFRMKFLWSTFANTDSLEFENRMASFQEVMEREGLRQGYGQVASRHLKLSGYQCQPYDNIAVSIRHLLEFVSRRTGWEYRPDQVESLSGTMHKREGNKVEADVGSIRGKSLDQFLGQQRVFSYVFHRFSRIRYTRGLD